MSLVTQINSLITAIGTDWKNIWAKIGTGTLNTTAQNLVAAVNEVKVTADAAVAGSVPDASTTVKGKVELATDAETIAYADTTRAVTPSNLAAMWTDKIDTNTNLGTSDVKVPSQAAVKAYADARVAAADAFTAKGGIDASTNPNYPAANAGDTYRITVGGKIGGASGPNVEVGDLIQCWVDGSAAGTQATVGANWDIIQVNIDGAVIGPVSSVSGNLPSFSGTSGKVVADSGVAVSTDGALTSNSDAKIPTEKAVKTYAQPLDADLTAIAAVASQTAYGRGFLALVDDTGLTGRVVASSETVAGKAELATQAETNTGTDDARIVTPLKFQTRLAAYAQPLDTDLTAIAALVSAANKVPYATGAGTWALTDFLADGRTLVGAANFAAMRGASLLNVYSQTEIGDPATDFVAAYTAAKA